MAFEVILANMIFGNVFLANAMLSAYLALAAGWDLRCRVVPNWLTLPALVAVGGWQIYQGHLGFLPAWAIIFALWMLRFFGGGDAKLMMVLFALFPGLDFLATLCWVALACTLPQIALKYCRVSPRSLVRPLTWRVATGLLPSEEDLEECGVRSTWIIGLAGVLYVWLHS